MRRVQSTSPSDCVQKKNIVTRLLRWCLLASWERGDICADASVTEHSHSLWMEGRQNAATIVNIP